MTPKRRVFIYFLFFACLCLSKSLRVKWKQSNREYSEKNSLYCKTTGLWYWTWYMGQRAIKLDSS